MKTTTDLEKYVVSVDAMSGEYVAGITDEHGKPSVTGTVNPGCAIRYTKSDAESTAKWIGGCSVMECPTLLGEVADGLNKSQIFEEDGGVIIACYQSGPQSFDHREQWLDSLSDADRPEAEEMLRKYDEAK